MEPYCQKSFVPFGKTTSRFFLTAFVSLCLIYMPTNKLTANETNGGEITYFLINGECQKLIFSNEKRECGDTTYQFIHDNGRSGFLFLTLDSDPEGFTFSGFLRERKVLKSNEFEQPVNMINTGFTQTLAEGVCIYDNPSNGIAKIECKAVDYDRNIFRAIFVTDGTSPQQVRN